MDKSKIAVAVFNKYAKEYEGRFMDVSLYAESFAFFCESIKKRNAEILELACGPGNITKYLLDLRPDLKIIGTDLSENMILLAKQNNPTAEFMCMDARKISSLNKRFDGIMVGFCLPYLSKDETRKLIEDASKILNSGGILYLSTMEDNYEKSGFKKGSKGDEIFMHYYLEEDLIHFLKDSNFEILKTDRKRSLQTDGSEATDLIIIAKNKN